MIESFIRCGPKESRTPDLCNANAALYQLSYGPLKTGVLYHKIYEFPAIFKHKESWVKKNMTYADSGVDYGPLDDFKRAAQQAARETGVSLKGSGYSDVPSSRGESAHLVSAPGLFSAFTPEGLGTKNIIADDMQRMTGKAYYDRIAQDLVAATINDIATSGARPVCLALNVFAGDSDWFENPNRYESLLEGFKMACLHAGCTWGPGETSVNPGLVMPGKAILSAPGYGFIRPKKRRIVENIQHGDAIMVIGSSGLHANGATLARRIAPKLRESYLTLLPSGRTFGEALLEPAPCYHHLVQSCLDDGVDIHYASNITGHGWRKLMRSKQSCACTIYHTPDVPELFTFMQEHGPVTDSEAYGTFNMGAGFALFVSPEDVKRVHRLTRQTTPFGACYAGRAWLRNERKVEIFGKGVVFSDDSLNIR